MEIEKSLRIKFEETMWSQGRPRKAVFDTAVNGMSGFTPKQTFHSDRESPHQKPIHPQMQRRPS